MLLRQKTCWWNELWNGISGAARQFCKSTHSTQRAESSALRFLSTLTHKAPNGFGWYVFFLHPQPSTIPLSAAQHHIETIQYNLPRADYARSLITIQSPFAIARCIEKGLTQILCICTWQCARWNDHQWETNECQTLSTRPTHLTCFCSFTSGFYRWAAARRRLAGVNWLCISALFCTTSSRRQQKPPSGSPHQRLWRIKFITTTLSRKTRAKQKLIPPPAALPRRRRKKY